MSADKSDILRKMRESKAIYVLMSDCTRLPFVVCDPETYDDEVFIFFSEQDAMQAGQEYIKENQPLKIFKIENKYMLSFYSSLFPIGVNCMVVGKGTEEETSVQLGELVRRPVPKPGEEPVENPELQLTAMYFMQKVRIQKNMEMTEDLQELQEELMAHYQKGRYITAVGEDKQMPVLTKKDGQVLQPVFTDVQEFLKFQNENKDKKFTMGLVDAGRIPELLLPDTTGIVVNPFGVDLQLNVSRPQA